MPQEENTIELAVTADIMEHVMMLHERVGNAELPDGEVIEINRGVQNGSLWLVYKKKNYFIPLKAICDGLLEALDNKILND